MSFPQGFPQDFPHFPQDIKFMLNAVPITQKEANEYISALHRHHKPARGDKYRIAVTDGNKICGVIQVGRPVSRMYDDGYTVEVIRLCTDGTRNACSFLYSAAARIAREMGYKKIITYILDSETGASLTASGYKYDHTTSGGSWDREKRHRTDSAPTCKKKCYVKELKK